MHIKTYRADSVHDALQMIRRDLGSEAFVLGTREVRVGGLLGLVGGRICTEVTASLDSVPNSRRKATTKPTDFGIDLSQLD